MEDETSSGDTLFELDPDALKAAEFMQAHVFLDALIGKTIAAAAVDSERTTITTTDGLTLVFCGFGGVVQAAKGT
jgi:hypothetical protein